jgi:hypothetical protein
MLGTDMHAMRRSSALSVEQALGYLAEDSRPLGFFGYGLSTGVSRHCMRIGAPLPPFVNVPSPHGPHLSPAGIIHCQALSCDHIRPQQARCQQGRRSIECFDCIPNLFTFSAVCFD